MGISNPSTDGILKVGIYRDPDYDYNPLRMQLAVVELCRELNLQVFLERNPGRVYVRFFTPWYSQTPWWAFCCFVFLFVGRIWDLLQSPTFWAIFSFLFVRPLIPSVIWGASSCFFYLHLGWSKALLRSWGFWFLFSLTFIHLFIPALARNMWRHPLLRVLIICLVLMIAPSIYYGITTICALLLMV